MGRIKPSRLRAWRRKEGLTLTDVAGLSGYCPAMISLVESGKRQFSPKAKVILSRRCGVPVSTLFDPEPIPQEALN